MKMRLTEANINEIFFERHFPENFNSSNGLEESKAQIQTHLGNAALHEIWFDGVHVCYGNMHLHEDLSVRIESDSPIIEMHFGLSGYRQVSMAHSKQQFSFNAKQHNIFYMPSFDGYFESGKQPTTNEFLEVHFTEDYFRRFLYSDTGMLKDMAARMDNKQISILNKKNMFITNRMELIVQELLHCNKTGILKRLFLESKVLELLVLQIEQFESVNDIKNNNAVKAYDIEKLHYAKHLLELNISNPCSLIDLAHKAGLNDFKLKKGFKTLFGTTVFGYLHELRMQEAKRLLLEYKKPIHEIAAYCGYEYVQHFTTAFKKKFGITPGKMKN